MSTVCAYPATAAGFSSVNPSHSASASASQVHSLSYAGEMPGFEFPGGRISQWPCDINCARGLHPTCPRNNNTSSSATNGKYNLGNNGGLATVLNSNNSQFPVPPISVETLFFKTSNNNSNNLNLYGFPTNNSHHNNSKGPPSYALNVVAAKLDQQPQQVNPKKRSAAHLLEKNRTGNVRWPVWPEAGLANNSLPPTPALVPTPNNQSHTQLHAEHHHPQQHHPQQQCLLCCHGRPKNGPAVNASNPAMASHHSFSSATAVNQQQDALFRRPLQERDPNCPRLGCELLLADEAMGSNGPTNPANANINNTSCKTGLKASTAGVAKESSVPSLPSSPAAASWAQLTSYYPPLSNRLNASHSNSRPLALDPKKDYSVGLSVDCSVEYDLPRVVRPPPGAQPLLMLAPRPSIPLPATPTLLRPPPLYPTSSASATSHSTSRARQSLDYRSVSSNNASQSQQQQQQWTRNAAAKAKQQQLNVASQTQRLLQQGFPVGVTAPTSNLVPLQEGNGRCGCPACLQQQQQRLSTTLQAARKLEANNGSGAVASTTSSASTSNSVVNSHYMPMPPAAFHPSALNGKPNWSHWSPPVGSSPGKGLSSAIPPATAATNFYHHQQHMLKQQQEWSSAALPALVKMSELSQQQQSKVGAAAECNPQQPANRRSSRKRSAAVLKNEPTAMACWPPNSVMTSGGASSEAKLARLEAHLSSAWYPVNNPTLWPMKVYQ